MIIYKITNSINDKIYIGLTRRPLKERFRQHCWASSNGVEKKSKIARAIRKYGKENFKIEEIEKCQSLQELGERERYWINFYDSRKNGYNILSGGISLTSDSFEEYLESLSEKGREDFLKHRAEVRQGKFLKSVKKTSEYIGVRKTAEKTFQTILRFQKRYYLKTLKSELEAAILYDKLALYFYGPAAILNFPENKYSEEELEEAFLFLKKKYNGKNHKYKDTSFSKRNNWCAQYVKDGKKVFSIYRTTEEEAHQARLEKAKKLGLPFIDFSLENCF
jgi:group I intron endonuclease